MARYLFDPEEFHKRVEHFKEEDEKLQKKSYRFVNDDRSNIRNVKMNDDAEIIAIDKNGDKVTLSFRVTAIMRNGKEDWI